MDLTPGIIVAERYRLEALVGSGGMGSVWRAQDLKLPRVVALKVLRADLTADPTLAERFKREAELLARIEHPAIVRILDVLEVEDAEGRRRPGIVMSFVKGQALGDVIRQSGAFGLERSLAVMHALLGALEVAHAAGIVHRDLKPHNVLLESEGGVVQVRLLDFGIAKSTDAAPTASSVLATQAGALLGTPGYMSPEQIKDPTHVDTRADLWAAAVCFFEMLTAQLPFPGRTAVEALSRVLTHPPLPATSLNPRLPRAVDEFFARALAQDLAARPSTAAQLRALLAPLAVGKDPTVPFAWPPPSGASAQGAPVDRTVRYGTPQGEPAHGAPTHAQPSQSGPAYAPAPAANTPAVSATVRPPFSNAVLAPTGEHALALVKRANAAAGFGALAAPEASVAVVRGAAPTDDRALQRRFLGLGALALVAVFAGLCAMSAAGAWLVYYLLHHHR
jgi:serine/threonine protein kinase